MTLLHQAAQKAVEVKQREAFEHWYSDAGRWPKSVARGEDGHYLLAQTNSSYEAWRAAAAALQQQPEPADSLLASHLAYTRAHLPALQHQEVPREPVDAERTMICKACGFDRFKEPCDRSPCEFVAVASITPQQETRSELSAEDRAILEAVHREMDECDRGNAPGHAHDIPGIWDGDNGAKAGKPCAWCLTWRKFTALVDGAAAPSTPENAGGGKEADRG